MKIVLRLITGEHDWMKLWDNGTRLPLDSLSKANDFSDHLLFCRF